jgi:hypothetical protein
MRFGDPELTVTPARLAAVQRFSPPWPRPESAKCRSIPRVASADASGTT